MVHLTRLELAHPKALPPQGSVYTNFTTGAYVYYNIFFRYGEKNLEIIPIAKGAIFWNSFSYYRGAIFGIFPPKSRPKDTSTFYGVRFLKVFFTDQFTISLKRSSPETRC